MGMTGSERGKEVQNCPQVCGKSAENAKKILFRGNKPKTSMNIKELSSSGAENKLIFDCKNPHFRPKSIHFGAISGLRGGSPVLRLLSISGSVFDLLA
jgi:hypothetical protein